MDEPTVDEPIQARESMGYMSVKDLDALKGVVVLDPQSTLVSSQTTFGPGVVLYPGVTLTCSPTSILHISAGCTVHSGSQIWAEHVSRVVVGASSQLGPGGLQIRCSLGSIKIGSESQLGYGTIIDGAHTLPPGSQIIGGTLQNHQSTG